MRLLTLVALFFALPAFAADYCSCYQVDVQDPFLRPYDLRAWLDQNPNTGSNIAYPYDCYWVTSTGVGDSSNCAAVCQSANVDYVNLTDFEPLWQQVIAADACKVPDKTSQGDTNSGCAAIDCTQNNNNNNGDTGGTGSTTTNITLPCGYPGAKYTDCNVYDAKVHQETKNITQETKNITAAVKDVQAATNAVLSQATSQAISLSGILGESKTHTTRLQEIADAAVHKGLKLSIGSCVEAEKLADKLPKVGGDLLGDKLLVGFTCSGDTFLCNQIKLQAQAYCRDVVSQRLQAMYLNGGDVLIKCAAGYVPQIDIAGQTVCHKSEGECLVTGQSQPMGKNLPPCDTPVTVTCPSKEFQPVILKDGFSCDTKLAAGKFNQQSSQLQQLIDVLKSDSRLEAMKEKTKTVVNQVIAKDTEEIKLSEIVTTQKPDLSSIGAPIISTSKSVAELVNANQFQMTIFGYKIWNPFDFLQVLSTAIIMPFASDVVRFLFAPVTGCQLDFSSIERSIATLIGGQGGSDLFGHFRDELCTTFIPFIRALLSMLLSWRLTIHVYFEVFNILSIVTSLGSSTGNAYGRSTRGLSSISD